MRCRLTRIELQLAISAFNEGSLTETLQNVNAISAFYRATAEFFDRRLAASGERK